MSVYKHSSGCMVLVAQEEKCTCFLPRVRKVFFIAVSFACIEYAAGVIIGSAAVRGDAWHLGMDSIGDLVVIIIATGAYRSSGFAHLWYKHGGRAQAILLLAAAGLILFEAFGHGEHKEPSALLMVVVGTFATAVNWFRYRALHPSGSIASLIKGVAYSFKTKKEEFTPFIGEAFHVISDIGVSIIVILGGVIALFGFDPSVADKSAAVCMALLIALGSFITLVFASRHTHSH